MQLSIQPDNDNLALKNASEPYLLVFEEGQYKLSTYALEAHADDKDIKRKRFHWPAIKFVSFKDGMLELTVTSVGDLTTLPYRLKKICCK